MRRRLVLLTLDLVSAVALGLGVITVLTPLILHLGFGADDDAYVAVVEAAGMLPVTLGRFGLEPMFKLTFLLWPAGLFAIGLSLRCLLWRKFVSPRSPEPSTE